MPHEEQWVVVRVGERHCGLPVEQVKEIVKLKPITPLPHAPGFVEGLMNLRGQIVPVLNLGNKLSTVQKEFCVKDTIRGLRSERVIVMEQWGELIGLHVDSVEQVLTLDLDVLERINEGELKEEGLIVSIYQMEDALILKLNTDLLLRPFSEEGGCR